MKEFLSKLKTNVVSTEIKNFLSSDYFPFVTAAVTLLCYYLGWDIVTIYYIVITGILILLLLDDITPCITLLLFMPVLISKKNSPSISMGHSNYYLLTQNLVQILVLVSLFIAAAIFRLALNVKRKNFKITPVFLGLCMFSAILLFNGVFSKDYNPKNLVYGLIMAACFLGIFSVYNDGVKLDVNTFKKIAIMFVALGALLAVELFIEYLTTDGLIKDGDIDRGLLKFGWGTYNNYGVLIVICIPPAVYLGAVKNYGFIFTLISILLFICAFMCCSRQAMIAAAIIYPICLILLFVKSKNRFANICIIAAAAVAGLILICVFKEDVSQFFRVIYENVIVNGELNGSGRMILWRQAISYFKSAPVLGVGFYSEFGYVGNTGLDFVPLMCHNTVLQLLSACGILGFAAYAVHRVQTVICLFKHPAYDRLFIGLIILGLLITSILDNHMFYIFPTMIYSALVCVLVKSEKN